MTKLAWSTRSRSNGLIVQWSRWHIVYNLDRQTVTLCGIAAPRAKWVTGGKDWRIKGGNCSACIAADKRRYPTTTPSAGT